MRSRNKLHLLRMRNQTMPIKPRNHRRKIRRNQNLSIQQKIKLMLFISAAILSFKQKKHRMTLQQSLTYQQNQKMTYQQNQRMTQTNKNLNSEKNTIMGIASLMLSQVIRQARTKITIKTSSYQKKYKKAMKLRRISKIKQTNCLTNTAKVTKKF